MGLVQPSRRGDGRLQLEDRCRRRARRDLKDGLHGLGGASFRGSPGAVAHWTLKDAQHTSVEIAYLAQPERRLFRVEADGGSSARPIPRGEQAPGYASFNFPPGSKQFTLRVTNGSVRLYGADFRKPGPGVVYSSLGINGANVTLLSHALNGPHWAARTAPLQTRSGDRELRNQ